MLGAGATLLALRDAGHRVVNLCCSLGSRREEHARRRAEVEEACRRAGFELVVGEDIAGVVAALRPDLLVAPSPDDAHPAHARVGEAALAAGAPVLWQWSLWSDLRRPTLYSPFGAERLAEARHVLAAHEGEVRRTDYLALLEARGVAGRVVGAERVFGFGTAPPSPEPYADVLAAPGPPRVLEPSELALAGRLARER